MNISQETVQYIAKLAYLELSDEESACYTEQLDQIIRYMEQLNRCDTNGIAPTAHPISTATPFRLDVISPSNDLPRILERAPKVYENCFLVPQVIEAEKPVTQAFRMPHEDVEADEFETVIGLEVHCQLNTRSKIFCSCSTEFGVPPNQNTCPVCLGMPGVLPVLNEDVVRSAIKAALATHCTIHPESVFARKNYFYPDLPKGYQISQYDRPLATEGKVTIDIDGVEKEIGIIRIHLEEDAGKSLHGGDSDGVWGATRLDFNRTGVPLIEIVSKPDLRSPQEAVAYLKELHAIVVALGVCGGNMEEGNFRCDANISIRPRGATTLGTRTELKNINSFRFVQKALEYEIARHKSMIRQGEKIVQETRLYDPDKHQTFSMRGKEEAHDYRYFPEPDLLPLIVPPSWIETIQSALPEMPTERKKRFIADFHLPPSDAEVLVGSKSLADFFETVVARYPKAKTVSNWLIGDILKLLNEDHKEIHETPFKPEHLANLLTLLDQGVISGKQGKTVVEQIYRTGKSPQEIIDAEGLSQISDEAELEAMLTDLIAANPNPVAQYRSGNTKVMGFFVGQIMQKTKGKANPKVLNELLRKKLG